jgi:hypothetical protein
MGITAEDGAEEANVTLMVNRQQSAVIHVLRVTVTKVKVSASFDARAERRTVLRIFWIVFIPLNETRVKILFRALLRVSTRELFPV